MTEREYMAMKKRYTSETEAHADRIKELEQQIEAAKVYTPENRFLASFSFFKGASTLSRDLLVALIDRIEIAEGNRVNIKFRFLSGKGLEAIVNGLNADGIQTQKGCAWHKASVSRILRNPNYTGSLLLQRFYSENHITKRKCLNDGELPKYAAEDTHEAIIDTETFNAVQEEIERRAKKHAPRPPRKEKYPYTGLIVCGNCGKHYRRKVTATGPVWICSTYNSKGKDVCPSKQIPEAELERVLAQVSLSSLTRIEAHDGNRLILFYPSGKAETLLWKDRSRSESWTAEMRAEAGRKSRERWENNA